MKDLKEICTNRSKWGPLLDEISRIEAFIDDPRYFNDVVGYSKNLLESVCNTIAVDLKISVLDNNGNHLKYQDLVKRIAENIGCIKQITALVKTLTTLGLDIATLRNKFAGTGHGFSVYEIEANRSALSNSTIRFIAITIEQLCILLINIYELEYPVKLKEVLRYEDNPDFNEQFDEFNDLVNIGDLGPYNPSEIIFHLDNEVYKVELENYKQNE